MSKDTTLHRQISNPTFEKKDKEFFEDAAMAAAGDVEAQQDFQLDEKIGVDEKSEQEDKDPFLVEWDGPDDPGNPLNYSTRRKVGLMAMIASLCFLTYFKTVHD